MLIVIGYTVVFVSVIGGYLLEGGFLGALYQPAEFLVIFGAGVGAFMASHHGNAVKATVKVLPSLLGGAKYNKKTCLDLMTMLYLVMSKGRKSGMMSLENDIDDPENSPLFSAYPDLLKDKLIMEFITDYLRLMISGNMDFFKLESLMDHEIETYQSESEVPAHGLAAMGDSLPAFGIVAAVMGVIQALSALSGDPAAIGPMIATAMVGTFLGILLAYGFINPLSTRVQLQVDEGAKILQSVKVTLLANLLGYPPPLAIEFGRKALFSSERPSFTELEDHVHEIRDGASGRS